MKRLHISDDDKVIAGVCGGLSESIGLDANIIRLIFVISIFFGLAGLWIYLALMFILPKNNLQKEIIVDAEEKMEKKPFKISRPWKDRMIAGVCSAIARYLKIDVSIVRITFVVMSFVSGVGLILYLIFWIIFPNEE